MTELPNLLLVAGTNRNVGKTTFICNIISKYRNLDIIGVKITPHFHNSRDNKRIIYQSDKVYISEELDNKSNKDSSFMLKSGAKKVYYIENINDNFQEVVALLEKIPNNIPIICESASLRKSIIPGLMVLLDNDSIIEKKPIYHELKDKIDVLVKINNPEFQFNFEKLRFENNKWNY
jgi:hypothetical protein